MPDRESCIVALANVLEETEGINAVLRQFIHINEVANNQFPAIIIEDDGKEEIENKSGDFSDVAFTISIIGYVHKTKDLSTALNELDKLTKEALGLDFLDSTGFMRSAGLAGFRILPLVERSGTESAPLAFFEREVELTYEGRLSTGL